MALRLTLLLSALGAIAASADVVFEKQVPLRRLSNFYADAADPNCAVGQSCQAGEIPTERGICVMAGASNAHQCWDVCNTDHHTADYKVSTDIQHQIMQAQIINQVRKGQDPSVYCPGLHDDLLPCNVGESCTHNGDEDLDTGICVLEENTADNRQCWDMCDTDHEVAAYCVGAPDGCLEKVESARSGWDCNAWWWIPTFLILLLMCCACALVAYYVRFRKKKSTRGLDREWEPMQLEPQYPPAPAPTTTAYTTVVSQPLVLPAAPPQAAPVFSSMTVAQPSYQTRSVAIPPATQTYTTYATQPQYSTQIVTTGAQVNPTPTTSNVYLATTGS